MLKIIKNSINIHFYKQNNMRTPRLILYVKFITEEIRKDMPNKEFEIAIMKVLEEMKYGETVQKQSSSSSEHPENQCAIFQIKTCFLFLFSFFSSVKERRNKNPEEVNGHYWRKDFIIQISKPSLKPHPKIKPNSTFFLIK